MTTHVNMLEKSMRKQAENSSHIQFYNFDINKNGYMHKTECGNLMSPKNWDLLGLSDFIIIY